MPTKEEFEAALKKVQRAQMSHNRSSTQTTDYEKARREFLPNVAAGSAAGFVGAPVDLVNMALQAFGRGTDKPVMGSNWIGDKLKANIDSPGFAVGQFLDPGAMSHAAISVAPALAGIIKANKGAHWYPYSSGDSVDFALKNIINNDVPPKEVYTDDVWANLPEHIRKDIGSEYESAAYLYPEEWKKAYYETYGSKPAPYVNDFIDNQLKTYMKKRMGTENDEIRKLADKGIKHADVSPNYNYSSLKELRNKFGFPKQGIAKTDDGLAWEGNVDNYLKPTFAIDDIRYNPDLEHLDVYNKSFEELLPLKDEILKAYPGRNKVIAEVGLSRPNAPIYEIGDEVPEQLGFNHMADELYNMLHIGMNQDTIPQNWPKDLILTPEQVNTMSVEDMVKKVAKVNKHREKMALAAKRKANERFANLEAVHTFDDGSRLVELPDPTSSDEAMDLVRNCGENGKWCTQGRGMATQYGSGNNRLMVLFDKDNNPVAQMTKTTQEKVRPSQYLGNRFPERWNEIQDKLYDNFGKNTRHSFDELAAETPEYQAYLKEPVKQSITELKGYDNDYVTPEHGANLAQYLKKGDWNSIADADSIGLHRFGQRYMTPEDAIRNPEFIDYMINTMDWDGNTEDLLKYQADRLPGYWNDWQNSLMGGGI